MNKELAEKIRDDGIVKIENFLDKKEILTLSNIVKYYSPLKGTPASYFPANFKSLTLKILSLNFVKFFHSLRILQLNKKKNLSNLADNFFGKKSELSFIDAYYSKISKKDVLPWHTDQAYSGKIDVSNFNNPDGFFLKIFIYLTDVGPDDGCMSYVQGSHKIGYAIRKAIYEKKIYYQPYWSIKDFKQIITVNKKYFDNYFEGTNVIDSFFNKTKDLEKDGNKKDYGYAAKAGSAIIFDEGGIHKGSRPQLNDRMVLRYLYSLKGISAKN